MPGQPDLRHRMIAGGIAAVIIPLFITAVIIFNQLPHALLDVYRQRSIQLSKDMATIIDVIFRHKLELVSAISVDEKLIRAMGEHDEALAADHLADISNAINADYYARILLVDRDGIVRWDSLNKKKVSVNVANRKYFRQVQKGETGLEGPLVSRYDKRQFIAIARPVLDCGLFVGAIVLAIDMEYMIQTISSIKVGSTGYAFVVDSDGTVIIHPERSLISNVNITREPGMERFAARIRNDYSGAESYTFRGTEKIAGFTHIDLTGWGVGFTQNRSEIMAPVNAILFNILFVGCLFLAVFVTAMVLVSKKISIPVERTLTLFKELMSHSDNAIIDIGIDRKIAAANPAAIKMLQKLPEQVIGFEPDMKNTTGTPPEEIWHGLMQGRIWSGNIIAENVGGERSIRTVMIIPVVGPSGKVLSFLEIARDITEDQKVESRLIQGQKMEALGAMAGGIAHDFNNILCGILSYAELSLFIPGNPSETEANLHVIMKASERARDLVNQILTFSRQTDTEFRPLIVKPVIKEAIKLVRASIPQEIEVRATITSESSIIGEPILLHQIVVNLCTNAVHAIGTRSGIIEISLDDMVVDAEFTMRHPEITPGKHVVLRITDSGSGMTAETLERIFEPFFTTKPQGKGTGLGLSVVHGIVRKLKGTITVYSTIGQGSVFTIIIPALQSSAGHDDHEVISVQGGSERIFLVDDEQIIIDALSGILHTLGYQVSAYTSSIDALTAFTENPDGFDIVITDYSMPQMSGMEMVERIRNVRSDIPVIVNSGYITQELADLLAKQGVTRILIKPVNTFQIADAIRNAFA